MTSVDVIILSWDRLEDTIAAIQSALDQKGVEQQIYVVDQGSKPDSLVKLKDFCARDPRIQLQCNTVNNGVPGGRNQASFAGKGKYIVALDNDAVFADEHQLEIMAGVMEAEENIGALAFRIKIFERDADDKSSWSYNESMTEWSERRFKTLRFVGAGHCIRRDVFEKIGGYDDSLFFLHEEVDLSTRIINAGYAIYYDPRVTIRHKVSAEHRVSWSGQRFYYDVRNKTYLHFKHGTRLPTTIFHTALMIVKGIRSGYVMPTLKGFFHALGMLPSAIRQRRMDKFVIKTEASNAYFESCSPTQGWSAMKRIRYRLSQAGKKVGA